MAIILKQFFQFIKILNSDTGLNQIAAGIACGLILGFSPLLSLQAILVFVALFLFRIQAGAGMLSAGVFKLASVPLIPLFHLAGSRVLEAESLDPFFTLLYQAPIFPLTRFNHSVTMGGGVISLILVIPVFFLARALVQAYREKIVTKFQGTAFWKLLKTTTIYKWYVKYDELFG